MKSDKTSEWVKFDKMKKLVGGWCTMCSGIPTRSQIMTIMAPQE